MAISTSNLSLPLSMHDLYKEKEQKTYDSCSDKIKRISSRFHTHEPQRMMTLLKAGGFPSWQAGAWFLNVRKRKTLLASADNKLSKAGELIAE